MKVAYCVKPTWKPQFNAFTRCCLSCYAKVVETLNGFGWNPSTIKFLRFTILMFKTKLNMGIFSKSVLGTIGSKSIQGSRCRWHRTQSKVSFSHVVTWLITDHTVTRRSDHHSTSEGKFTIYVDHIFITLCCHRGPLCEMRLVTIKLRWSKQKS